MKAPRANCTRCPDGTTTASAGSVIATACSVLRLLLQTGLTLTRLAGGSVLNNGTRDGGLCTQYAASYNDYNGVRYQWPGTQQFAVTELSKDGAFRVLLAFPDLLDYVPSTASILSAKLTFSGSNWDGAARALTVRRRAA